MNSHVPASFLVPVVASLGGWTAQLAQRWERWAVTEALLHQLDATVDVAVFDKILLDSADLTKNPAIGVIQGSFADLRQLGLVGWVMMNSSTLAQALSHFDRYNRMACSGIHYEVVAGDKVATVTLKSTLAGRKLNRVLMDGVVTSFARLASQLLGRPVPLNAVDLAHDEASDSQVYLKSWGVIPRWRQLKYSVEFPVDVLSWRVQFSDGTLLAEFQRKAEAELARRDSDGRVTAQVRAVLTQGWNGKPRTLASVASACAMASRTVQAHLQREGNTFSDLLEESRRDFAVREITTGGSSIKEVAWLLGYSELSSFYAAFHRWTGVSPGHHRQLSRENPVG